MPPAEPTVGMAMIVRDEANTIEKCLASWWDHVDVAAIVDTGSTDGTMDKVRAWADQHPGPELRTAHFEWVDDFAAARNFADVLIEGICDWKSWVDADDVIRGADQLRPIARGFHAQPFHAVIAGYDYAQAGGRTVCYLKRERLVRTGLGYRWHGRVHEATAIVGPTAEVGPDTIEWVHSAGRFAESNERNQRILHAWVEDEPDNARVVSYLGSEALAGGSAEEAVGWFERYLALKPGWPDERAQIHRRHALALYRLGRLGDAEQTALKALTVRPDWPDSYLTLAECAYRKQDWENAVTWATKARHYGVPDTMLIVNPLDYQWLPLVLLAGARGALGDWEGAIEAADEARAIAPHDEVDRHYPTWRAKRKSDLVSRACVELAETLVGHDEQAKALALLEGAVPYFVHDHPAIVAARSSVRERLLFVTDPALYAQHYTDHDEKGHDEPATVRPLPRAAFLLAGLREQIAA